MPGPDEPQIEIVNQYKVKGRNGFQDKHIYVRLGKEQYHIWLHAEFQRTNSQTGKHEVLYRCTVRTHPSMYPLYSGFEHPDSVIPHFLRKAKVIP